MIELHRDGLVDLADAALATDFYREWRRASNDEEAISATECVGYRVPLFLGGADEVSNLERTDIEVYWSFTGQMWRRLKRGPLRRVSRVSRRASSGQLSPKRP